MHSLLPRFVPIARTVTTPGSSTSLEHTQVPHPKFPRRNWIWSKTFAVARLDQRFVCELSLNRSYNHSCRLAVKANRIS